MPVHYVRKAELDDAVTQAAVRMESRLRAAFLAAIIALRGKVNMQKLTDAIARNDSAGALAILALDANFVDALRGSGLEAGVASFRDAIQQTFAAGAKGAIGELPTRVSVDLSFNALSPEAIKFLDSYEFALVRELSQQSRDAIQQALGRAFREGGSPAQIAREIRDSIGLTARQELAVANYQKALESGTASGLRDALERSLRDGRYDRSLLGALRDETGLKQAQIDKMVERYRERAIQNRAQAIARTESLRASQAGQREVWRQAKEQGLIDESARRRWITSGDDRTCDECDALDDAEAGLDEEFEGGYDAPPAHPDCRCALELVFGRKAA